MNKKIYLIILNMSIFNHICESQQGIKYLEEHPLKKPSSPFGNFIPNSDHNIDQSCLTTMSYAVQHKTLNPVPMEIPNSVSLNEDTLSVNIRIYNENKSFYQAYQAAQTPAELIAVYRATVDAIKNSNSKDSSINLKNLKLILEQQPYKKNFVIPAYEKSDLQALIWIAKIEKQAQLAQQGANFQKDLKADLENAEKFAQEYAGTLPYPDKEIKERLDAIIQKYKKGL
jgi:hypothetical protein